MKSETEIKAFIKRLSKITGFISKYGDLEETSHKDFNYLRNLDDALNWVLDKKSSNELFKSNLKRNEDDEVEIFKVIEKIEERTGQTFVDFES